MCILFFTQRSNNTLYISFWTFVYEKDSQTSRFRFPLQSLFLHNEHLTLWHVCRINSISNNSQSETKKRSPRKSDYALVEELETFYGNRLTIQLEAFDFTWLCCIICVSIPYRCVVKGRPRHKLPEKCKMSIWTNLKILRKATQHRPRPGL